MVKKPRKSIKQKLPVLIAIGILTLSAIYIILTLLHFRIGDPETLRNLRNLELMSNAKDKLDTTLCNQIEGDIKPPETPKNKGIGRDIFNGYPAMTESEAKERCRNDVQWQIDHQDNK